MAFLLVLMPISNIISTSSIDAVTRSIALSSMPAPLAAKGGPPNLALGSCVAPGTPAASIWGGLDGYRSASKPRRLACSIFDSHFVGLFQRCVWSFDARFRVISAAELLEGAVVWLLMDVDS